MLCKEMSGWRVGSWTANKGPHRFTARPACCGVSYTCGPDTAASIRTSSALGSCFFGSRLVPDPVPMAPLPWLRGSNLPRGLLLKPAPLLLVMGRACRQHKHAAGYAAASLAPCALQETRCIHAVMMPGPRRGHPWVPQPVLPYCAIGCSCCQPHRCAHACAGSARGGSCASSW